MFGQSRRKSQAGGGRKQKGKTKDPDQSENFYLARMENDAAKLAAIKAAKTPATAQATRSAARHEPADGVLRSGRREGRAKRPFVPHPDCQAALDELRAELASAVKCARK